MLALGGDHIGPEVLDAGLAVAEAAAAGAGILSGIGHDCGEGDGHDSGARTHTGARPGGESGMSMTCGDATMRLLARYGVTTVFGIPGVHTLDLCRGMSGGGNSAAIAHVQARNEQGAGFMAEGWARATGEARVRELRAEIAGNLTASERRHARLLSVLHDIAPADTVWSGDACQLVYTGGFAFPTRAPRRWFYPAGYCALGNALPNAIGAKMAKPEAPVSVLAGDGGFMFTMPELLTAAEAGLSLPVVIWENGGLKQIQDDMDIRGIPRVGVEGINPDFVALAKACHCHGLAPRDETEFRDAFRKALAADRPTVILVREGGEWLR